MSSEQLDDERLEDPVDELDQPEADTSDEQEEQEAAPLHLTVAVESPSACERHVTVTIAREDVERYFEEAYRELMPTAAVPGFRPGRAPRKLVENRFRKEVSERVKGSLVMDSMSQLTEEQSFSAISEPVFDLDAVEVPDEGDMTFEFDVEVRPEFDLPEWKGLVVERPVREFNDQDIDARLEKLLARYGRLVPFDGKAKSGDYVTVEITTMHEGREVCAAREQVLRICPVLSFRDGKIEKFDKFMSGAKAGDVKELELELTADAPNEDLQGKKVQLRFEVLEIKRLELPELTAQFLTEMGDFGSVEALREAIRDDLRRQLAYHQSQQIRRQINTALTASADWELPPGLLRRQSARELERMVLELKRSGFSDGEIRARENELRQNSAALTATALKEHFILEKIAEEGSLDVAPQDYDEEIHLIALQSGEPTRRVRAQLEKRGLMDVLRNQIIERKVIDLVRTHAKFKDKPFKPDKGDVEAIDLAAGGGDRASVIPEVKQKVAQAEQDG